MSRFLNVHSRKTNMTGWKIHHLKMYFLLKIDIFQCPVSFQGGNPRANESHPPSIEPPKKSGGEPDLGTWWHGDMYRFFLPTWVMKNPPRFESV